MRPVPSVPRTVDNKYRIEQLLGRGGMGAVYRARDMRLDRLVALKVVRAELLGDPEARRRFRREAQIVARLQHPSIVAVFDYGTFPKAAPTSSWSSSAARIFGTCSSARAGWTGASDAHPLARVPRSAPRTARACCTAI